MAERFRNGGGADWQIAEPNPGSSEHRGANRRGYDSGVELPDYRRHPDLAPPRLTSSSTASSAALLPFDAAP
jgi:hypothetical protein